MEIDSKLAAILLNKKKQKKLFPYVDYDELKLTLKTRQNIDQIP